MTYKMQWLNVSVKDTFEQISTRDKQVKTKDCLIKGDYPVVDQGRSLINGFVNDETKVINLNKKPIVIFGDHTRIIKWINFNFVPGADGTKLLMPKEFLIPRFFYYQLKSIDIKDRGYG
ncbi:MAG: specificity determinant for hsdM and hsdR, partial [Gammaproteobacteria bacterium]|nr:specificity determinant for hsdM and hsdR [Gammaproteobacteria bacterium]